MNIIQHKITRPVVQLGDLLNLAGVRLTKTDQRMNIFEGTLRDVLSAFITQRLLSMMWNRLI